MWWMVFSSLYAGMTIEIDELKVVEYPKHIDVIEAAKAGAHIATVPYNLVMQMVKHPLTDQGLEKFKADWAATFGK